MVGQLFHGIDSETLLAVPFFLLVGELMASSDVVHRMIRLSQTLSDTCAAGSRRW
jgi:TRAP-type C4-dicarboxylate transport system permease large subunit